MVFALVLTHIIHHHVHAPLTAAVPATEGIAPSALTWYELVKACMRVP